MANKKRIIAIRYLPQDELALENAEYYDLLFTEAHILEIYKTSFASLLIKTNKDYLIDSSTWYFHPSIFLDVENKITIERLAEAYDLDISNLEDTDFKKFVEKVVNFQESVMEKEQKELEMWMEEKSTKKSKLAYCIPPYFPIVEENDSWFELNMKLFEITESIRKNLMPILLVGDYDLLLNPRVIDHLVSYASQISGNLLGLGILGFDRFTVSSEYLLSFKELVERITKEARKEVFSVYSSPLDPLLKFRGLCYSIEGKGVKITETGGGGATPRVYFSLFKKLFSYPIMKTIISNYGEIASKDDFKTFSLMETLSNTNERINSLKSEAFEYSKGKLRFHKSKLQEEKRGEYDKLSEEKKELTAQIKTHTLKERYLDTKKNPETLILEIKKGIEIVEKKEKISPIKMQYIGHLKRWLDLV
ncbi:MAG: hypothetical protein WED07_16370 [Candidatus Freyarchaeum deiterrae]